MNSKMDEIKIKAYAKINLSLYITGIRDDGYHLLDSVFVPISLYDEITIKKEGSGISVKCDQDIPTDQRNTAFKAASLIMEKANIGGVAIEINKNIPVMAGLGGGSADAAAVLYGMNSLFDINIKDEMLKELGLQIGADVPFFLSEGAARVQGIGEIITPIKISNPLDLILIKPKQSLSTKEVYKKYDETYGEHSGSCEELSFTLEKKGLKDISKFLKNDLQKAAVKLCPEVQNAIDFLKERGALGALMTGSGSCVFGIFKDEDMAKKTASQYTEEGRAYVAKTQDYALQILE